MLKKIFYISIGIIILSCNIEPTAPIEGCMDNTACNFDENAGFANITIDEHATLTCGTDIEVTYSGTLTNNGSLGTDTTDDGSGTISGPSGETKSHASFGRGDGGKTAFGGDAANDLDQANWVESYFLDQTNRLG